VLLKNGADPNIRNELGKTALDWALSKNHGQIAEVLKAGGATK
jgi:ankyrin repeat protein